MAFTPEIALQYLRGAQARDRLAHAYLITGPAGSGKRALAGEIAALVNGAARGRRPSRQSGIEIAPNRDRTNPHARARAADAGERRRPKSRDHFRCRPHGSQAANAFLKTLEEPPNNSLLLLLSSLPEVLPDTIISRCLTLPLAAPNDIELSPEAGELLELLDRVAEEKSATGVHAAYQLAQGLQRLLGRMRAAIVEENAASAKAEELHYKQTTDAGIWLEGREEHFKALTESVYLQRRAELVEILFRWWADVLRASERVSTRECPRRRKRPRRWPLA